MNDSEVQLKWSIFPHLDILKQKILLLKFSGVNELMVWCKGNPRWGKTCTHDVVCGVERVVIPLSLITWFWPQGHTVVVVHYENCSNNKICNQLICINITCRVENLNSSNIYKFITESYQNLKGKFIQVCSFNGFKKLSPNYSSTTAMTSKVRNSSCFWEEDWWKTMKPWRFLLVAAALKLLTDDDDDDDDDDAFSLVKVLLLYTVAARFVVVYVLGGN